MSSTFFTDLSALMKDRQELRITIKKIGDDLATIVVPNFKDEGKHIYINGTAAELDQNFITELGKPLAVAATSFSSNADEVAKEVKEEAEEDAKAEQKKKKQPAKPAASKKAPAKKTKKEEPAPTTDPQHEADLEETLQDEAAEQEKPAADAPEPVAETEEAIAETKPAEAETKAPEPETSSAGDDENEKLFAHFMSEGDKLFTQRKYSDAATAFDSAVELKPDDKKALAEQKRAHQWVKAVAEINK